MWLTLELFRVKPKIVFASDYPVEGQKGDMVLNLTRAVGGGHYLSGSGAKVYIDEGTFAKAGIGLSFQEFHHPHWAQSVKGPFQPATFALEWIIEEGEKAVEEFHRIVSASVSQPARCLV